MGHNKFFLFVGIIYNSRDYKTEICGIYRDFWQGSNECMKLANSDSVWNVRRVCATKIMKCKQVYVLVAKGKCIFSNLSFKFFRSMVDAEFAARLLKGAFIEYEILLMNVQ